MNWQHAKHYWPFAQYSQFTLQKPHLWHIQDIGTGPVILLIHGAGSTTHSWQHLVPFSNGQIPRDYGGSARVKGLHGWVRSNVAGWITWPKT